jgi:putative membrane protein
MKRIWATAGVACLLSLPLGAQSGTPQPKQGTQPKTTQPKAGAQEKTAGAPSATDKTFAREAAIGGMAEVELGRLAADKASSADVKQFGQRMVDDHGKANDELKSWASQKSVTLPTELDAKHKATRDRLSKLSGAAFDRAYMHEMVTDHDKDVQEFKHASKTATDSDLKAWAAKTLPTLEEHQKMAHDVNSKVGGAAKSKSGGASKH